MPLIESEYSCPVCKRESGKLHQIVADGGKLQCKGNPAHVWMDHMEFTNLGPTMDFKVARPQFAPQEGHTPYQITIPITLKDALETKFGERLSPTVVGILRMILEGDVMMIAQTDLQRLTERLGKRPDDSGELVGMVYALTEDVKEAKMIAETATQDLKAYEGMSPGRVIVSLGDQLQNAMAKAADASLPLSLWASRALQNGLKDSWF